MLDDEQMRRNIRTRTARPPATLIVTVAIVIIAAALPPETSACPEGCLCRWKGGKETTECVNKGMSTIPSNIDSGTQVLDMTGNNLQILPKEVFLRSGLLNLQRLHLVQCNMGKVDRHAFSRLANLVELDLAQNRLSTIPTDSFVNVPDLRRLVLSGNALAHVGSKAFVHLKSLLILELANCLIEHIDNEAFDLLPALQQLKLNGNRLRVLGSGVFAGLRSLVSILLTENPWTCDCHARDFREWLLTSEVPYHISPQCALPARLKGFDMDKLIVEDFACAPTGSAPYNLVQVQQGSNVTLECRVSADPEPSVYWLFKDEVITNGTGISEYLDGRTFLVEESSLGGGGNEKTSAILIESVELANAGPYICVAENRGGRYLVNFTLDVSRMAVVTQHAMLPIAENRSFLMGVVIGLGVFALFVFIVLFVLLVRCCNSRRKRDARRRKLPRSETQETKSGSNYDLERDDEKRDIVLHQPTNPVQKPPRSYANSTHEVASQINLHDYGQQQQQQQQQQPQQQAYTGSGSESANRTYEMGRPMDHAHCIKPDIIKMDASASEYSVPRSSLQLNGNAASAATRIGVDDIYHRNTGRWSTESPTCHTCGGGTGNGDATGSCLGVPCLHGAYGVSDVETGSEQSYRANFRPTASGLAGETNVDYDDVDEEEEETWPRPPPPLYDTIKKPVPVAWNSSSALAPSGIPPRIDERYELSDYPVGAASAGATPAVVWERQSPTTTAAAAAATSGLGGYAGGSSSSSSSGSSNGQFAVPRVDLNRPSQNAQNVPLQNSVPAAALSPYPLLNFSTIRDSPDEGYEDEGDEGTEMPRVVKQKVRIKERRL